MTTNRQESTVSLRRACASLAALALLAACTSTPEAIQRKTGWMRSEVADSYIYAYPLVLMDVAKEAATADGAPGAMPVNTLRHAQALPAPGAANPPLASVDMLDSTAWLDVAEEPVVVVLPDGRGRYVDARALDMWTNVLWSSGPSANPRSGASRARTLAFVGAGWEGSLPEGVTRVDAPARNVWLDVRVQTSGGRDLAAAKRLQRAIRVEPLSVYTGDARRAPRAARADAGAASAEPASGVASPVASPVAQVAALDPPGFFSRVARALQDNPPPAADAHAQEILADIGVTAGAPVQWKGDKLIGAENGAAEARERLAALPPNALAANGWSWLGDGVGNYGQDYALRAYAASTQFGAGTRDDEIVAVVKTDSAGRPLNGAHRYVIRFAPNALPPARAFWSLAPYTPDGAVPELGRARRSIGERDRLHRNRDGSLEIVVSATPPGKGYASNWLPAPRADFELALRLYAPKRQAADGNWQPPAVVRK
ncbi:DUF1254 domain-containing protein [Burkholderia thailandensis]|uniref:Lipoprotein, putative n=2 Tax=Burkholderia thailandensis TaxID=57975 RepID=Q2T395_BURTA|nr:DUF1254 domain-containing protein [Burkholderia thailandensis]ABC36211.1 lipoprotein, putative [Burkholderia thailandensis E264]AOJ48949.1 hypothetical protein WJ27_28430 [Burkholderia thailandensis]AVR07545.1 DUF1254 domain-containing protein [Burkholderia thailandensis]AWY61090.1 hypothetical protein A8H35_22825 [Burkholderia thailandensis]KVG16110.1 hypothetical protein WJ25_23845 [Burkholderia thailandensis]